MFQTTNQETIENRGKSMVLGGFTSWTQWKVPRFSPLRAAIAADRSPAGAPAETLSETPKPGLDLPFDYVKNIGKP